MVEALRHQLGLCSIVSSRLNQYKQTGKDPQKYSALLDEWENKFEVIQKILWFIANECSKHDSLPEEIVNNTISLVIELIDEETHLFLKSRSLSNFCLIILGNLCKSEKTVR